MSTLNSGQSVSAGYILRERLNVNAGIETWRAEDPTRQREVALKFLQPGLVSAVAHASLQNEFAAAAALKHPAIAGGYSLERHGDQVLLVRDFIPGRDLSSLRGQDWRTLLRPVTQLAQTVAVMHARDIIHRDIKSSNVILKADGSICVIDLGAAAQSDGSAVAAISPYSASPQQYSGAAPAAADDSYAFGVLLYELLSGYPPFFPNVSRERVLHEAPAVLKPVHPVPPALQSLVMSLLSKDARSRPDMSAVAQKLALLGEPATATSFVNDGTEASPPVATIVRTQRSGSAVKPASGKERNTQRWAMLGLAGFAALAVAVLIILPRFAPPPPPVPVAAPVAPKSEAAPKEIDYEQMAIAMEKAEQAKGTFDALFNSYEKRGAAQWASEPFNAARVKGELGARQFANREFDAALENYKAGLEPLQIVADVATRKLQDSLEAGNTALLAGQSLAAQQAFKLALAIDPDSIAADKGLKRSNTLDRVFALLAAATNDERAGALQNAVKNYEAVLALDPDTTVARDKLAQVQARIANDRFAATMAEGMQLLHASRLSEARATFGNAARMRPGAREVQDALAQVAQAEKRSKIEEHRRAAEAFVQGERWGEAIAEYKAALALDGSLEFARTGQAQAEPRLQIATQFEQLLAKPERLQSAAVRDQARALLAVAGKAGTPGPVLKEQMQKLETHLSQSQQPVPVVLESDSLTRVAINRVTELGTFDRRELQLLPGSYTVVGTRAGYRDVRREFTVQPGQAPPKLIVRCEERI